MTLPPYDETVGWPGMRLEEKPPCKDWMTCPNMRYFGNFRYRCDKCGFEVRPA